MSATSPRYALYYAPRPEEMLAATASQWLGRNPETGQASRIRAPWGTDLDRLDEITAEPRRYGFHGTLKPPMALAEGISERDLLEAVGKFANARRAFTVPSMVGFSQA